MSNWRHHLKGAQLAGWLGWLFFFFFYMATGTIDRSSSQRNTECAGFLCKSTNQESGLDIICGSCCLHSKAHCRQFCWWELVDWCRLLWREQGFFLDLLARAAQWSRVLKDSWLMYNCNLPKLFYVSHTKEGDWNGNGFWNYSQEWGFLWVGSCGIIYPRHLQKRQHGILWRRMVWTWQPSTLLWLSVLFYKTPKIQAVKL